MLGAHQLRTDFEDHFLSLDGVGGGGVKGMRKKKKHSIKCFVPGASKWLTSCSARSKRRILLRLIGNGVVVFDMESGFRNAQTQRASPNPSLTHVPTIHPTPGKIKSSSSRPKLFPLIMRF